MFPGIGHHHHHHHNQSNGVNGHHHHNNSQCGGANNANNMQQDFRNAMQDFSQGNVGGGMQHITQGLSHMNPFGFI